MSTTTTTTKISVQDLEQAIKAFKGIGSFLSFTYKGKDSFLKKDKETKEKRSHSIFKISTYGNHKDYKSCYVGKNFSKDIDKQASKQGIDLKEQGLEVRERKGFERLNAISFESKNGLSIEVFNAHSIDNHYVDENGDDLDFKTQVKPFISDSKSKSKGYINPLKQARKDAGIEQAEGKLFSLSGIIEISMNEKIKGVVR
jgi:hypothetical protein